MNDTSIIGTDILINNITIFEKNETATDSNSDSEYRAITLLVGLALSVTSIAIMYNICVVYLFRAKQSYTYSIQEGQMSHVGTGDLGHSRDMYSDTTNVNGHENFTVLKTEVSPLLS